MRCRASIIVIAALAGCGGKGGSSGSCKIVDEGGARTLVCPDGSRARLPASRTCTVTAVGEGSKLQCDDGSSVDLPTGGCVGEPGPSSGWILHCGDVDLVIPADAASGDIAGTVSLVGQTDASGTVVTLEGTRFSATTDAAGTFTFDQVPAGVYVLRFEHATFEPVRLTNLVIEPGRRELGVELRRSRLVLAGTPLLRGSSTDAAVFSAAGTAYLLRAQDPGPLPLDRDGDALFSPKGTYLYEGGKVLTVADPTRVVASGDPFATSPTFSADERFLAALDSTDQLIDVYELATETTRTFAGGQRLSFQGDTLLASWDLGAAVALRPGDTAPVALPCDPDVTLEGSWALCRSGPTLLDLDALTVVPLTGAQNFAGADAAGHAAAVWVNVPQRALMVFEVGALDRAAFYSDVASFDSFSPDGLHILYWDRESGRRLRDIRDGTSFGVPSETLYYAADGGGFAYLLGQELLVEPYSGSTIDLGSIPGLPGYLIPAGVAYLVQNDGPTVLLDRSLVPHPLSFAVSGLNAVSPDGRTLMLTPRSQQGLRAVDLTTFTEEDVPGATEGKFTSSGRRFVFKRPQDGQLALVVHDLDNGAERVLDTGWIGDFYPMGDWVLFQRQSLSGEDSDAPDGLWQVSLVPPNG